MSPFRRHTAKEQLGQVLIQRGVITPEQLKQALAEQKERGGLLGEVLVKLKFASEEEITQALAIQHDFPYLPLANYEIDPELTKFIPEEISRKYFVLPVDKMSDILTVVMANPLDENAMAEIAALSKCKIEVFVSTYTEIREAIQRLYVPEQPKQDQGAENGEDS